ncbi:hypothetical protein KJ591_02120 [Patescibacteria group bacterium]|nr:hypothetical protein [Patescibacteria group bacterium]
MTAWQDGNLCKGCGPCQDYSCAAGNYLGCGYSEDAKKTYYEASSSCFYSCTAQSCVIATGWPSVATWSYACSGVDTWKPCSNSVCTNSGWTNPCSAKLVFISSVTYSGHLSGYSGADQKCQQLASNAGLPGTYKAWISDSNSSPSSRFNQSGKFVDIVGDTIADNWTDLTNSSLDKAIQYTEQGGGIGTARKVWTGTDGNGTADGTSRAINHCDNWTSTSSSKDGKQGTNGSITTYRWSDDVAVGCNNYGYLYCFQQ